MNVLRDLRIDPARTHLPATGICVRALGAGVKYDSVDIAHLDKTSLWQWLRSRGGENMWAENVVALLLGHTAFEEEN
jgi:hypothetical protein